MAMVRNPTRGSAHANTIDISTGDGSRSLQHHEKDGRYATKTNGIGLKMIPSFDYDKSHNHDVLVLPLYSGGITHIHGADFPNLR
jgi:hypothetical protein